MIWPGSIDEPLRNNGNFDPVPYRDWDYPENARNIQEQEDHGQDNDDCITEPENSAITTNDNHVLADAQIDKSKVHELVLIGGFTRIPRIQKLVTDYFERKEHAEENSVVSNTKLANVSDVGADSAIYITTKDTTEVISAALSCSSESEQTTPLAYGITPARPALWSSPSKLQPRP